jgi:hypothetical protein
MSSKNSEEMTMYRTLILVAVVAIGAGSCTVGHTQEVKKAPHATAIYRTLNGTVSEVVAADKMVKVELAAASPAKDKSSSGQAWTLSVGHQTLLLRAGKNGQLAPIDFGDLKPGETIQAVATLQADPSDHSHTAWWLVVYPAGTTPTDR